MKKFFLGIIILVTLTVSAQTIEKVINNNIPCITVKDSNEEYLFPIEVADINKPVNDQKAIALSKYLYLKNNPPELNYKELRRRAYPSIADQLDMIYWDTKNGTKKWIELIDSIKAKYPKK